MIRALLHVMGVDDVSGRWYAFWSGFGSDLAMFAAATGLVFKYNCHVDHCWRVARLPVDGTPYFVCHRHFKAGSLR